MLTAVEGEERDCTILLVDGSVVDGVTTAAAAVVTVTGGSECSRGVVLVPNATPATAPVSMDEVRGVIFLDNVRVGTADIPSKDSRSTLA